MNSKILFITVMQQKQTYAIQLKMGILVKIFGKVVLF